MNGRRERKLPPRCSRRRSPLFSQQKQSFWLLSPSNMVQIHHPYVLNGMILKQENIIVVSSTLESPRLSDLNICFWIKCQLSRHQSRHFSCFLSTTETSFTREITVGAALNSALCRHIINELPSFQFRPR